MKTLLSFVFVLVLTLFITGCGCLTPPSDDSIVPKTSVAVIYYDGSGQEVIKSVSSDNQNNLLVEIPSGWSFQVIYTVNDEGGVKSIKVEDGVAAETGEVLSFEEITDGEADFSSCAKPYQSITTYYSGEEEVPEYNFQATGIDFNGNESKTPILTVKYGG